MAAQTSPAGWAPTLALGAALACFVGAAGLDAAAVRAFVFPEDCSALGSSECGLIHQVARDLGWRQGLVAVALLMLGIPLLRWARMKNRQRKT